MTKIFSYVVRYDSGFAPNPFFGYCTLATCKPRIRKSAKIGDWIIGTGSNEKTIKRGKRLVYAMRVTEETNFDLYWQDERFYNKRPIRNGSRKQQCGDNIYHRLCDSSPWEQVDSYHTHAQENITIKHIRKDTKVDRILISEDFYYFGGEGPEIPKCFRDKAGVNIVNSGAGETHVTDDEQFEEVIKWLRGIDEQGFLGEPLEWIHDDASRN